MIKYIKITKDNIDYATSIQMQIIPEECAYYSYLYIINKNLEWQNYYLVYDDDKVIGITGLYCLEDINETNSIWLGWFGVLEQYRRLGYGKRILLDTIEMAKDYSKKYPIKYFRLYTSTRDNPLAQPLYESVMDIKEEYINPNDTNYDNTCVIYSKSLNDKKVTNWDNKNLHLNDMIKKEKEFEIKYNNEHGLSVNCG